MDSPFYNRTVVSALVTNRSLEPSEPVGRRRRRALNLLRDFCSPASALNGSDVELDSGMLPLLFSSLLSLKRDRLGDRRRPMAPVREPGLLLGVIWMTT